MNINRRELLAIVPASIVGTAAVVGAEPAFEPAAPISMGLGQLASNEITFVRQFRFLFSFDHMGADFNYSINFDRVKKEIKIRNYEVARADGSLPYQEWIDAMLNGDYPDETLTLTTYDGCGNEIYKRQFTGLSIKSCSSSFDMSDSEVSMPETCMTYEGYKNIPIGTVKHPTYPKATQVDHLNGRTWTD